MGPGDQTRRTRTMALVGDVLNCRDYPRGLLPGNAVYVGRGSRWGNPFKIGQHGDRAEVIRLYRRWLWRVLQQDPAFLAPLVGCDLACWCAPAPCHAHVLVSAILWRYRDASALAL